MKIVGYATIKNDATTGISPVSMNLFQGKNVAVLEFATDGGVLCISNDSSGIGTFDKQDVLRSFECEVLGHYVLPPRLNIMEQTLYMAKCQSRKGGYNQILKGMVIAASLHKGTFTDSFLWQKQ